MKSSGISIAKQRDGEGSRIHEPLPARAVDPRRRDPAGGAADPRQGTRLREDWFERTYEQLRGFLDEMFN